MAERHTGPHSDALTRRRFLKGVAGLTVSAPLLAALAQLGCGQQAPPTPANSAAPAASSSTAPASSPASASQAPVGDAAQAAYQKAMEGWAAIEAAAKKEGRVVVANTAVASYWDALRKGFKARYPEIELEFVGARGPEQRERARTEVRTGTRILDISLGTPMDQFNMIDDGILEPWKAPAALDPTAKWQMHPYDANYFAGEGHFAAVDLGVLGILINTKLVPPADEPKTWLDLADPKWKGKMIGNPPDRSGGLNWYYNVARKYGPDFIAKMKATEYTMSDKLDEMARDTGRGEYAVCFSIAVDQTVSYMMEGMPLKFIYPQDGALGSYRTIAIVKNPPRPNAAKVFVNWILTKDGQKANVNGGHIPLMLGLDLPHPALNVEGKNINKMTKKDYEELNRTNKEAAAAFGLSN